MKKLLTLALVLSTVVSGTAIFTGCSKDDANQDDANQDDANKGNIENNENNENTENNGETADLSDLKVGFIFLHDENSTYDKKT